MHTVYCELHVNGHTEDRLSVIGHVLNSYKFSLDMSQKLSVYILTWPGAFPLVIDHALTLKITVPFYHNHVQVQGM